MSIRKKIQLFKYYTSQNSSYPLSIIRIILDALFINFIIWLPTYSYIVYKTKSPLISALLSFITVVLLNTIILIKKYNIYTANRKKRRREIVINHLSHRISQLNEQEFLLQLIKILVNCREFSNIYKENKLLKADYNNTPAAIGYHHPPPGEKTPFSKVWEFIQQAKNLGFKHGFFFTSSTFDENCNKQRINNMGFSIQLMDINYILHKMDDNGMFPDELTIDQLIMAEIQKQKIKKQEIKNKIFTSNKSKQYLSTSILFLFTGVLFKSLRPYFLVLSLIFSILAFLVKFLASESTAN